MDTICESSTGSWKIVSRQLPEREENEEDYAKNEEEEDVNEDK